MTKQGAKESEVCYSSPWCEPEQVCRCAAWEKQEGLEETDSTNMTKQEGLEETDSIE